MQSLISHLYRKAWWLSQHTANRQPTDGYIFIMPTMGTKEDTGLLPPHYTRRYILGVLIISADIRGCSLLTNWFRRAKHTDTTILICRSHQEIQNLQLLELDQLPQYQPVRTKQWNILDTEENQDIQDIRCCLNLRLETLIFYRQLFITLDQLEDPVRLRTVGAEAKLNTGDAALYRELSTCPS